MLFIKGTITALSVLLIACSSTNKATIDKASEETVTNTEKTMKETAMKEAGFLMAEVVASRVEGDCPFTLKVNASEPYFLDPVNITDEYKKNGEKVWVKYSGLRMMNRCEKATPVNIVEIERRSE